MINSIIKLPLALLSLLLLSLLPAKAQQDVLVDNFEIRNSANQLSGAWSTFNDGENGGKSIVKKGYVKDSANKNQYLQFSYKLQKAKLPWNPFVALQCNVPDKKITTGLQAVTYTFKGDAHSFIYQSKNISDYCYYQIAIPACKKWTAVTIPLSHLSQPGWGKPEGFNAEALKGFAWQVTGRDNDTGAVAIDNVKLLYTPQLDLAPIDTFARKVKIGNFEFLYSDILKEKRPLYIYLPAPLDEMKASGKKYPVIYLLDGYASHSKTIAEIIEKYSAVNYQTAFPEMIVVGIDNTDRTRDLTPTHTEKDFWGKPAPGFKTSGGGTYFTQFIEKELIPHIDSMYPTANYRTLIGHSFAGLTTINILLNYPHIFDAYLAIDPSLWWDNKLLIKQAANSIKKLNLNNKKLFITIANNAYKGVDIPTIRKDTSQFALMWSSNFDFVDVLKKSSPKGFKWDYKYYPNEDHMSVLEPSEYDGLRYFFELNRSDFNDTFTISPLTDSTFTIYNSVAPTNMGYSVFPPEKLVNDQGRYYLNKKDFKHACTLFKMNTINYPASPFAFYSMGEYYEAIGDNPKAIENYLKVLALKTFPPDALNAKTKLQQLKAEK